MAMRRLKCHQVQGLCIPSGGLFVNPKKRSTSRGSGGDRIDHVKGREGGGSVKADQVSRDKPWSVTKSAPSCFGKAGEDIALHCLVGDDVHPCRINDCDDPVSSRARQLYRDIAEVPRASDRNLVIMASSMATRPLIKSGPCSGKRYVSTRLV